MLTLEEKSGKKLHGGLLAWDLLRQPGLNADDKKELDKVLGACEAAKHFAHGRYARAGRLLEQIHLETDQVLPLQLAQECYIAGGHNDEAGNCIARSLLCHDRAHKDHGHFLALLATGHLQAARLADAEETARVAVEATAGSNIVALSALLGVLTLQGRSSEAVAVCDDYSSNHHGQGLGKLLFFRGVALVQRGNYKGTNRVLAAGTGGGEEGVIDLVDRTMLQALLNLNDAGLTEGQEKLEQEWRRKVPSTLAPIARAAAALCGVSVRRGGDEKEKEGGEEVLLPPFPSIREKTEEEEETAGPRPLRDVFHQVHIENLLRGGKWTEARLLLSQRLTLAPNDAQAWRRQASVLGRLGLTQLAQAANYTAWQLGIGQGGFGGPR
jgi:tetratricopeptide (TPR) repeat protein